MTTDGFRGRAGGNVGTGGLRGVNQQEAVGNAIGGWDEGAIISIAVGNVMRTRQTPQSKARARETCTDVVQVAGTGVSGEPIGSNRSCAADYIYG